MVVQEQNPQDNLKQLQELQKIYLQTFNTPSGNKVLEDLKSKCFFLKSTYPVKSNDALRLAFNEGQRTLLLHIVNMMNLDIERMKLLTEKGEQENG